MSLQSVSTSTSPSILRDCDALVQIKVGSRSAYLRTFDMLFVGDHLLRMRFYNFYSISEKLMISYTMWSMYSTVNSVSKWKYSFNLNQYCRVTALLNSYDTDIKKKANIFSTDDINRCVNLHEIATPYWMVLVCLAYYGGLRHTEMM